MKKSDVIKYNRKLNKIDLLNPLSIGNGDFVMTLDITSTQSLANHYSYIPLTSISNRLWFDKKILGDIRKTDVYGKKYMIDKKGQEDIFNLKRQYPHKYNLFLVKLLYMDKVIEMDKILNPNQELDLYSGIAKSQFLYDGKRVNVKSVIYQNNDHFNIEIDANSSFKLAVEFLYPSYEKTGYNSNLKPEIRVMDNKINVIYNDDNSLEAYFDSNNKYMAIDNTIVFDIDNNLSLNILLHDKVGSELLDRFWDEDNSIIIDNDILVERMILSKYLLKINSTGIYPPSEAGLTYNNWNSKFHLEMHPIHSLWLIYDNHLDLLLKSFDYYLSIYATSKVRAEENGYKGIRLPKMTSPDGLDSPSNIGPLLVWQEPHIVFMLQEIYRIYNRVDLLFKYEKLISGVIDFMISYLTDNEEIEMLDPLLECCESIPVEKCHNPMFEIEYFRYVFEGQAKIDNILYGYSRYDYDDYAKRLIKPKASNNVYLKTHDMRDELDIYPDHPTEVFSYSYFKSSVIDDSIMKSTLEHVLNKLDLTSFWGWDFPFMGMAAINLGNKELGVKLALMDSVNNKYLYNGHNTSPREDLRIYLPGNGAYLLFYNLLTKEN